MHKHSQHRNMHRGTLYINTVNTATQQLAPGYTMHINTANMHLRLLTSLFIRATKSTFRVSILSDASGGIWLASSERSGIDHPWIFARSALRFITVRESAEMCMAHMR